MIGGYDIVEIEKEYNAFYSRGGWEYCVGAEAKRLKMQLFDRIDLAEGSTVLDVGCGLGVHTEAIRQLGYKPIGVDISEVAIEEAKRRYTHVDFIRCDVEYLAYPDNQFDMVFMRGISWCH